MFDFIVANEVFNILPDLLLEDILILFHPSYTFHPS